MNRLLKTSAGVLALMAGAGIAMAQTGTGTTGGSGMMASDITCAQIAELDNDQAERALYFIAGQQSAQADTGMETDTTAGAAPDTTGGADTGTDTMAGADTGTTGGADTGTDTMAGAETDTTGGADTGTDTMAGAETDTTGGADTGTDTMAGADTGTAGDVGTDTTTTAGTTADTGLSGVSGYFEIPVESVMTACQDSPDSPVVDILQQQGGFSAQ